MVLKTAHFNIKNIKISKVNLTNTLTHLNEALLNNKTGYVCVTNSRTIYLANKDPEYCEIQNNSLLTVPDGAPLVWIAHNKGYKEVEKVSGKDLMDALFEISDEKGYSHYFYGSSEHTIKHLVNNLKKKHPNLDIKDAVSPPFQPVEAFDIDELATKINRLKPTFFWCGLGAPKQEKLIAKLQPKLDNPICVGVGLAFEYIGETVKRAPNWMQKYGLEGIFRLAQQPNNVKREVRPLSWILVQLIKSFLLRFIKFKMLILIA